MSSAAAVGRSERAEVLVARHCDQSREVRQRQALEVWLRPQNVWLSDFAGSAVVPQWLGRGPAHSDLHSSKPTEVRANLGSHA